MSWNDYYTAQNLLEYSYLIGTDLSGQTNTTALSQINFTEKLGKGNAQKFFL